MNTDEHGWESGPKRLSLPPLSICVYLRSSAVPSCRNSVVLRVSVDSVLLRSLSAPLPPPRRLLPGAGRLRLAILRDLRSGEQRQDRLDPNRRLLRDPPLLVDQVGDRGGKHPVLAGDLPLPLQDHWEGQPVLGGLGPVGLSVAPADHQHLGAS